MFVAVYEPMHAVCLHSCVGTCVLCMPIRILYCLNAAESVSVYTVRYSVTAILCYTVRLTMV